ncbi:MAG: M28 family peptidase [Armatimonadota bacterium]
MTKWRPARALLTVFASMAFLLTAGCTRGPAFDETRAWRDLQAQVDFGYRVPGTKAHLATRDWLVEQLTPLAAKVTLQPFSHKLGGREVKMWNIIADFPGTGKAPREQVLLAAHWDTRPTADYDAVPARRTQPIAGANDGASGVAVLLEIARQLKARPIARDVQIVLFDGEDYGSYPNMNTNLDYMLLGSQYYADHLPAKKPSWGILLDMVGDANLDIFREPNSENLAKAVNDRVFAAAATLGYLKTEEQPGFVDSLYKHEIIDDHIPINKAGVPMADLIDFNYIYWHTSYDTPERCSAESLKMVGETVLLAISSD